MRRGKRGKYGNLKVILPDGTKFDSGLEFKVWQQLAAMQKLDIIEGLERQVPYRITINGQWVCTYYADFVYTLKETGETCVVDAKGVRTAVYRLKKKLMKIVLGIEIQEVRA